MSPDEVESLRAVGRRLASTASWWGGELGPDERTVIRCSPLAEDRWEVCVIDAVGIVSTESLQLVVEPKIPTAHLLYLFAQSGHFPRLDTGRATTAVSESLWELVAEWFTTATEQVFRQGVVRDYQSTVDALRLIRGRLNVPDATRAYYAGRTEFSCHFEEFGFDNPLNRVLNEACRIVRASQTLPDSLRRRASRLTSRLDNVGNLHPSDLRAKIERKSRHYRDAYLFAKHVIRDYGRDLTHGEATSWTFLIRTPEMVEAGLRQVLSTRVRDRTISKRGMKLHGSSMRLNPDIVVDDGIAIADVKYKLAMGQWNRRDLYQVVAFAAGYRAPEGSVINFRTPDVRSLPPLQIGDTRVTEICWTSDAAMSPEDAAIQFASAFTTWLRHAEAA